MRISIWHIVQTYDDFILLICRSKGKIHIQLTDVKLVPDYLWLKKKKEMLKDSQNIWPFKSFKK